MSEIQIETDSEWNPYQSHEETIESLRQQLAECKAKNAELTELNEYANSAYKTKSAEAGGYQIALAECQATNGNLREALGSCKSSTIHNLQEELVTSYYFDHKKVIDALALPNDATALNELIAERTKTQREYYESVFQDGANRITELTAEVDRLNGLYNGIFDACKRKDQLIAEQNKLNKERQEWALHTSEVIRELRQQNAELTVELQSTRLQMITDFGQYQEAHEKVKELIAQRDEAMKDAERYRWLVGEAEEVHCRFFDWETNGGDYGERDATLDEAIDAAISNCKEQK